MIWTGCARWRWTPIDAGAPSARGRYTALALVDPGEHLYLDCVSDFLPDYYGQLGFDLVARQTRCYPDGVYDISLLRQPGRRTDVTSAPAGGS